MSLRSQYTPTLIESRYVQINYNNLSFVHLVKKIFCMSNQHVKKSYNYSYVIKYKTCTLTCFKDVLLFKKINMLNVDEKDIQLFIY